MANLKTNASLLCSLLPLFLLATLWFAGATADTKKPTIDILDPPTVSDAEGNKADSESNIEFSRSKGKENYNTGEDVPTTIAMASWFYDMSSAIVSSSMAGAFPFDSLITVRRDGITKLDWRQTAKDYMGYLVAMAVGVILMVIVPIAGCCFCCCRCNRRCGGRRKFLNPYEAGYKDNCNRITTIALFSVFLIFAITGTVLMVLANHSLTTQLYEMKNGGLDKLDNIETFLNNVVDQAEVAIFGKYNFTVNVLKRDLANIGFLIGQPTRRYVLSNTGLDKTYDQVLDMENDAKSILELLREYNGMKSSYDTKTDTIAKEFGADDFKSKLDKALASAPFAEGTVYKTKMLGSAGTQLPDATPLTKSLEDFLKTGISSIIETSRAALNDLPEKIKNETVKTVTVPEIESQFTKYAGDMQTAINQLKTLRNNMLQSYKSNDMKKSGQDFLNTVTEYDTYRWYGGLGLAILAFLADVLLFLAVSFGIFGGNANVEPSERSKLSNRGGNLLLAGSVFAFITTWLLILLTTPLFMVGAPVDTFACSPIRDPSIIDKLINQYDLLNSDYKGNGTWLGNQIFPDKNVEIKLAKFLSVCSSGGTIYTAFQADLLDLDQLADFEKNFDIDGELSKLSVDFTGTTMKYGDITRFLALMKTVAALGDKMELAVANSAPVLTEDFEAYLTRRSQDSTDPQKNVMTSLLASLKKFKPKTSKIDPELSQLKTIIAKFKAITNPASGETLPDRCDSLTSTFMSVDTDLSRLALDAFSKAIKGFASRMQRIIDRSADGLKSAVKTEIGVCKPLYDIYDDILRKSTCDYILGSLVAWACAMGMTSVFLLLTICVSCGLSKHLYRMDIDDGNIEVNTNFATTSDVTVEPSAPPSYHVNGPPIGSDLFQWNLLAPNLTELDPITMHTEPITDSWTPSDPTGRFTDATGTNWTQSDITGGFSGSTGSKWTQSDITGGFTESIGSNWTFSDGFETSV